MRLTRKNSSLLLAFLSFSLAFTLLLALLAKLCLEIAVHGLRLARHEIFSLHLDSLMDTFLNNLHVPEDREVILATRVQAIAIDASPCQSQ